MKIMMNYKIYVCFITIPFIVGIIYLYKYFKIKRQKENYIEVQAIVTYSSSLLTRYGYKT